MGKVLFTVLLYFFICNRPCMAIPASKVSAGSPPVTEIRVTLFGQPCFLTGPTNESTLKAIHSISPEKIPPVQDLAQATEALKQLRKTVKLPPTLDLYREKLDKYYEAQVAFFEGLSAAKEDKKIDLLVSKTKSHIGQKRSKEFEDYLRKLEAKENFSLWKQTTLDSVLEIYNELVQPYPEEDFHKAISRMSVRYTCSFGENE